MNDCRVGRADIFYLDRSGKALGAALKTEPFAIGWVTQSWTAFSFPSVQTPSYSWALPWSPIECCIRRHLLNPAIAQRMPTTLILFINNSQIFCVVAKGSPADSQSLEALEYLYGIFTSLWFHYTSDTWHFYTTSYKGGTRPSLGVTPPAMLNCIQIRSSKQGTSLNAMPVLHS